MKIQENVLLANYTTFRLGGPARYFCEVENKEDLMEAVKWAKEKNLPVFVLGGGSNLLAPDEGFTGLAIKMKNIKIKMENDNEKCKIECDAGVSLAKIILESTRTGYSGLEWGFGIPGTVGGAILGNAGRLGQDISQIVEKVKVLDLNSLEEKEFDFQNCDFQYRSSRFKEGGFIILSAVLRFKKTARAEIEKTLAEAKEVAKNSPLWPSAGCIFKNYQVADKDDALLMFHPELTSRVRSGKIGVGFLIDQCGLAGRQVGGAKIWEKHANYIINVGGAQAREVKELMELAKKSVKEKFGVELKEEIKIFLHRKTYF